MLLLKDKCDSLGIEFYVFDGICDINLHCLRDIRDVKGNQEKIKLLYLYQSIKDKKYDYENDNMPDVSKLIDEVKMASTKLLERVKKFNIQLKSNVFIKVGKENVQIVKGQDSDRHLYCDLDLRLLNRILNKKAHWNNAEIGTHINFKRVPNKMDPDVHTCMSFFHL